MVVALCRPHQTPWTLLTPPPTPFSHLICFYFLMQSGCASAVGEDSQWWSDVEWLVGEDSRKSFHWITIDNGAAGGWRFKEQLSSTWPIKFAFEEIKTPSQPPYLPLLAYLVLHLTQPIKFMFVKTPCNHDLSWPLSLSPFLSLLAPAIGQKCRGPTVDDGDGKSQPLFGALAPHRLFSLNSLLCNLSTRSPIFFFESFCFLPTFYHCLMNLPSFRHAIKFFLEQSKLFVLNLLLVIIFLVLFLVLTSLIN